MVLKKTEQKWADQTQVAFEQIAISGDGTAVGWVDYYQNCCTSYPVPILVEVYKAGKRHAFQPGIAPWHWCFVDGSSSVAAISTTVHGPQHEVIERGDIASGKKTGDFVWMQDGTYPDAPSWVVAIRQARIAESHVCSTKSGR